LVGIMRIGRFRADGLAEFNPTSQSFLNSLAPLLAFPLAASLVMLLSGEAGEALHGLLAALVGLLAPPVLSQLLASAWGRQDGWLRYAVAFNWCQWAIPLMALLILMLLGPALVAGAPTHIVKAATLAVVLVYGFALHVFLARHGLRLEPRRAVVLVVACNLGTFLLMIGPEFLLTGFDE
jgi:hypothetical protein